MSAQSLKTHKLPSGNYLSYYIEDYKVYTGIGKTEQESINNIKNETFGLMDLKAPTSHHNSTIRTRA